MTSESEAGVTKYQYNSKGLLAYVVNPGGEVVSYSYDDYGRKAELRYPDGRTVRYSYDEMDRLTAVTGLDGESTRYSYDGNGQRTRTESSAFTTEYEYDSVGNLTRQRTTGRAELTLEYVYDLNGGMTEEVRTEKGTGVKSSYTYDALGRLTGFVSSDGQSESYRYDAAGNMLEKQRNNRKIAMTYDAANRLRTMESGGKTLRYAYDGSGNLLQKTLGNRVDSYSYDAYNRLVSYRGYDGYRQRYSYSAAGHLTKKETLGSGNRRTLEESVCGDGKKAASSDGEDDEDDPDPYGGAATSAQAAPAPSAAARQVTSYVYDITAPYYEVLTETTEGATVSYDYGLERLAAHSADFWASRRTEYLYDGRGSVALEYSYNNSWYTLGGALSPGETVSRRYTPFGEPLAGGASRLSRNGTYYGYNGESYDPATGMLNLRARQYEPAQMRFSQAAPPSAQDRLGMLGKRPANPPLEQRKKWPSAT